jgi:PAS domain S-box-containing protein
MMSSEGQLTPGNSCSNKFSGAPATSAQAPFTNPAQVASTTAELERQQTDEIVRAVVDQAIVGFVQADLNGCITFANDRYCEITGYSREELLGMRWHELTHPDDMPSCIQFFQRMVRDENPFFFEKRYVRKNGEIIWVSLGPSQIRDAGGRVAGGAAFVVDISGRKQALDELRVSEEKYRLLFENSRDALMTLALPSRMFTSANRSTLRMFGAASEAEFTSLRPWDISPERQADGQISAEKALQMIATAIREGSNFFEWTHMRLDGRTFPAEVLLTRMEQNGQVSIQATVRDISRRKMLEKEIQERRNQMTELQKREVVAQTASAFAHELNQPLLAVASYSEAALILLKAVNPDLDKIRKALEGSALQAHRAGQSIREMLKVMSMNEFSTEAFDLSQEIHTILDAARSEYDLQFHSMLRLEAELPLIQANRAHLKWVLLNLLHNGIEAALEADMSPPSITMSTRTIEDEYFVQLTIQDNGPGINQEDFQHLFEPFFTTKARGIGMGLAISRSLIEANGGRLWVDLQRSPGAGFHLTLPFAT